MSYLPVLESSYFFIYLGTARPTFWSTDTESNESLVKGENNFKILIGGSNRAVSMPSLNGNLVPDRQLILV